MKYNLSISPSSFKTIKRLPNTWTSCELYQILDLLEYGDTNDITESDLEEMVILALSELEPEEGAELVLKHIFGDALNSGQIHNMSHEMKDEKAWEEYAEISKHEQFFVAGDLLYKTFGGGLFPLPEAVSIQIDISVKTKDALNHFKSQQASSILKVLALGMPKNAIVNRLFHEQLEDKTFEEAKNILWQIKETASTDTSVSYHIISSEYWCEDFKYAEDYVVIYNTDTETFKLV